MNLKNNKGYVAVDASIAILILLIMVPTIVGMIYNVNKTNNYIDRKTEAISIAINTIEAAKGIDVGSLNLDAVKQELKSKIYTDLDETEMTLTKDENTYKVEVIITDYADTDEGKAIKAQSGYVKNVKVIVTFRLGKQQKKVELSTVIS